MNAQATRRGVPAVALWGGVGALAWAAITVLTGGSSAHADEQSDPSLLGGVTSLVSQTVSTVGDTVTAVTQPVVTQVVAPVVTEVVAPAVTQVVAPVQQAAPPVVEVVTETVAQVPVVGPATAPVVETVAETAESVVDPVAEVLTDAPVSQILNPILDAAGDAPLLGDLLKELGVIRLVDDVVAVIDDTTGIVGEAVGATLPPVISVLDPAETVDSNAGDDVASVSVAAGTLATRASAASVNAAITAFPPVATPATPATSAPASEENPASVPAPFSGPVVPSSAGSGGGSAASPARLGDAGPFALRAEERTPGAPDDVLPTSLVADTDVSPD